MTNIQKQKIGELRTAGESYGKIAEALGMSVNTIKSFCKRNNVANADVSVKAAPPLQSAVCEQCGQTLIPAVGKRSKRFCSDGCRLLWWKNHRDKLAKKAVYSAVCGCCGAVFESYGNKNRKFCSHECYIKSRFGGIEDVG